LIKGSFITALSSGKGKALSGLSVDAFVFKLLNKITLRRFGPRFWLLGSKQVHLPLVRTLGRPTHLFCGKHLKLSFTVFWLSFRGCRART